MTKSKPSLRNSTKTALLFSLLLFTLSCGCQNNLEPTYKEDSIPRVVKQICKDEYGLDVTTKRTATTLWIYAPLPKILHKDYGVKEDKIFDDEMMDKLRNILITIGRVLVSSDNTPDFYALVVSDINIGLDYTIMGNMLDIKKSYSGFIPWTEANRRYVIQLKIAPSAVGDTTGSHLLFYDVKLPDFLAEQIAQRIGAKFQEEGWKKYFKVVKSEGRFDKGVFIFEYSVEQISKPDTKIEIPKEIMKTIAYCIKTYEFKDFSAVEITNLVTRDKLLLSEAAIWGKPTD